MKSCALALCSDPWLWLRLLRCARRRRMPRLRARMVKRARAKRGAAPTPALRQRLLHAGRGPSRMGDHVLRTRHTRSGGARNRRRRLKRLRVDVPPGLAANPQALPSARRASSKATQTCASDPRRRNRSDRRRRSALLGLRPPTQRQGLQPANRRRNRDCRSTSASRSNRAAASLRPCTCSWKVTSATPRTRSRRPWHRLGDYHEWFEIDNVPRRTPKSELLGVRVAYSEAEDDQVEAAVQRPRRKRQLPHPAERMLDDHDLLSGTRNVRRRTREPARIRPWASTGCDNVPFKPSTEVKPETSQLRRPRRRHDGRQGSAARRRR